EKFDDASVAQSLCGIALIIALPVGNVKGGSDSHKFSPAGILSCGKPSEKTGHRNMPMTCFL
ncbi:hypothetical protein, partial [uncultured Ruminococcus sp.]